MNVRRWITTKIGKQSQIFIKTSRVIILDSELFKISLSLTFNMAGSIKMFSFNRRFLQVLGIYSISSNHGLSIDWRNSILISNLALFCLPSAAFFIYDAKSMFEYGLSFSAAAIGAFMICIYFTMISQVESTSAFYGNCERFIGNSQSTLTSQIEHTIFVI